MEADSGVAEQLRVGLRNQGETLAGFTINKI